MKTYQQWKGLSRYHRNQSSNGSNSSSGSTSTFANTAATPHSVASPRLTILSAMNKNILASKAAKGSSTSRNKKLQYWIWMATFLLSSILWSIYLRSQHLDVTLELDHMSTTPKAKRNKICFVQSYFTDTALTKPANVTDLRSDHLDYDFYYFTNLTTKQVTPGWKRRLVAPGTDTRKYKFLAWKEKDIQESCRLVLSLDAGYVPRPGKAVKFHRWAQQVAGKGLIQLNFTERTTLQGELERWKSKEQNEDHDKAILAQIESQQDWNHCRNTTVYWNSIFAYDPAHRGYQNASSYLVNTWHKSYGALDQSLWAYTLCHVHLQPMTVRSETLPSFIQDTAHIMSSSLERVDPVVSRVSGGGTRDGKEGAIRGAK